MSAEAIATLLECIPGAWDAGVFFDSKDVASALSHWQKTGYPPPLNTPPAVHLEGFLRYVANNPHICRDESAQAQHHARSLLTVIRGGASAPPGAGAKPRVRALVISEEKVRREIRIFTEDPEGLPAASSRTQETRALRSKPVALPAETSVPRRREPITFRRRDVPPSRWRGILTTPVIHCQMNPNYWQAVGKASMNVFSNAALMPVATVVHTSTAVITKEITPVESLQEMWDAVKGFGWVAGPLLGFLGTWDVLSKRYRERPFGQVVQKFTKAVSPRVLGYSVATIMVSALTYVALRKWQDLPSSEAGEYRKNFLKEMGLGISINWVTTSAILRVLPFFKIGGWAAYFIAGGMGVIFQEMATTGFRKYKRTEFKERNLASLVGLIEEFKYSTPARQPLLMEKIDRRFKNAINIHLTENGSRPRAIEVARERWERRGRVREGKADPEILSGARRWIAEMNVNSKVTYSVPMSLLPAQQGRIVETWQEGLAEFYPFLLQPMPVLYGREKNSGRIPVGQFMSWSAAETMALFHEYLEARRRIGLDPLQVSVGH